TFAKRAGASVPDDRKIDGVDIWPVLVGDPPKPPRDNFYYFRGLQLQAVRSGPRKLHLAYGDRGKQLYHLGDDIGESKDLAADRPEIVAKLQTLADAMDDDLGTTGVGPGCRAPGRNPNPRPLIDHDGAVRPDAVAK